MNVEYENMDKQEVVIEISRDDLKHRFLWWDLLDNLGYGRRLVLQLGCDKIKLKISHTALLYGNDQVSLEECKDEERTYP